MTDNGQTLKPENVADAEFQSVDDALNFLYKLSLDDSSFRFRGQANSTWTLQPSIYRFSGFQRYQTVTYESCILAAKPPPVSPLTHTEYQLEWLMVCQHYGVPTRLLDWTKEILIALYFACDDSSQLAADGTVFLCNQNEYPKFAAYNECAMETQDLAFVNTTVLNPRMRTQSGCFMMWGHAPLGDATKESYDLWQYHKLYGESKYLQKVRIPSTAKRQILKELKSFYSITSDTIFLNDDYLEKTFGPKFEALKEDARLKTLYLTDADRLSVAELRQARSFLPIECRNMIGKCENLRKC
ncbi:MAG: FRG domain-containing protein [Saccharofermentanales bacterium]